LWTMAKVIAHGMVARSGQEKRDKSGCGSR
jgi:hypothetical protein